MAQARASATLLLFEAVTQEDWGLLVTKRTRSVSCIPPCPARKDEGMLAGEHWAFDRTCKGLDRGLRTLINFWMMATAVSTNK